MPINKAYMAKNTPTGGGKVKTGSKGNSTKMPSAANTPNKPNGVGSVKKKSNPSSKMIPKMPGSFLTSTKTSSPPPSMGKKKK